MDGGSTEIVSLQLDCPSFVHDVIEMVRTKSDKNSSENTKRENESPLYDAQKHL
jgi:hypothetical protein